MITLSELAQSQRLEYQGNGEIKLASIGTIENASSDQIAFLANSKYTQFLSKTNAGAVILTADTAKQFNGNAIISPNPYLTFAYIAQLLAENKQTQHNSATKIHTAAVVSDTAVIGKNVHIDALSYIGEGVTVADGVAIGTQVTIADGVKIGKGCNIKSGAKIEAGTQIGERVIIHPGAVIGADGFGLARGQQGWVKIPQTGVVEIGDDCEIGANTTIDCGAIENTVLGKDVRLDNQIQVGHNVHIGDHTVIAGCTAIAGSTKIGKNCLIGGGVGIVGHIEICDGVTIQAMALVTHSINKPDTYSSVPPLQTSKTWRRNAVRTKQLDQMAKRINQLEKKINE